MRLPHTDIVVIYEIILEIFGNLIILKRLRCRTDITPASFLVLFHKNETGRLVNTTGQCCLRKVLPFNIIKTSISATDCATLRVISGKKVQREAK